MRDITEDEYRNLWREQIKVGKRLHPEFYRCGPGRPYKNQYTTGSAKLSMNPREVRRRERRAAKRLEAERMQEVMERIST